MRGGLALLLFLVADCTLGARLGHGAKHGGDLQAVLQQMWSSWGSMKAPRPPKPDSTTLHVATEPVEARDCTLLVHGSIKDLANLDMLAAAFQGPIHASFLLLEGDMPRYSEWKASIAQPTRRFATLHLVQVRGGDSQDNYPIGALLNAGMRAVTTDWVFVADVHDTPLHSHAYRSALNRGLQTRLFDASTPVAYIVTSWQWTSKVEMRDPRPQVPGSKLVLVQNYKNGLISVKEPDDPAAFGIEFDLPQWSATTRPVVARFVSGMRPAVIVPTTGPKLPLWDQRLTGHGGDCWHLALSLLQYGYAVLPDAFLFRNSANQVGELVRPAAEARNAVWMDTTSQRGCPGCTPVTCPENCPHLFDDASTDTMAGTSIVSLVDAVTARTVHSIESVLLPVHSMPPRKLVIAVVSAPGHRSIRDAIRQSWSRTAVKYNVPVFFFCGEEDAGLERHGPEGDDLIRLKGFAESYANLPRKVLLITEWVVQAGYQSMMKVDDDTFVNVERLLRFATANEPLNDIYAGQFVDGTQAVVHDTKSKWYMQDQYPRDKLPNYANGPGILLGQTALLFMYKHRHTLPPYRVDDAGIGIWLQGADSLRGVQMEADIYEWKLSETSVFISPVAEDEMMPLMTRRNLVLRRCEEVKLCHGAPYSPDWDSFAHKEYQDITVERTKR